MSSLCPSSSSAAPAATTVNTSSIAPEMQPYYTSIMNRAVSATSDPNDPTKAAEYQAYPGQLVAGLSPLQQNAIDTTGAQGGAMTRQLDQGMYNAGQGATYAQQAGQGANDVAGVAQQMQGQLYNAGLGSLQQGRTATNAGQGMIAGGAAGAGGYGQIGQAYQNAMYGQGQTYLGQGAGGVAQGQGGMQRAVQGSLGSTQQAQALQNALYRSGSSLLRQGQGMLGGQSADLMTQGGIGALGVGQNAGTVAAAYNPENVAQWKGADATAANDFNQGNVRGWTNPYQQGVTDIAKEQANRQFAQQQNAAAAQAAAHGALGGYRDQLRGAEDQRNQNILLNNIQMQGDQQSYDKAIAAMGQQSSLGLQQSQINQANQGLGINALQGQGQLGLGAGQLGLSGYGQAANIGQNIGQLGLGAGQLGSGLQGQALNAAQLGLAGYGQAGNLSQGIGQLGLGQQGVGANLQGQSINAGQLGLAGYGQSINAGQAAGQLGVAQQQIGNAQQQASLNAGQLGLAGLGQYGNQGVNLANIGQQQFNYGQTGLNNLQTLGALQQQQQQNDINAAYSQYQNAQMFPQQQLNFLSGILRGTPQTVNTTSAQYQAPPSIYSQLAGLGMAGAGLGSLASRMTGG